MKYMTFNGSCSFAGIANMLEQHGFDTDDRTIALGMDLPYLFVQENGVYMAGPMLQSACWFDLYLNAIGFELQENSVKSENLPGLLKQHPTAMIGLYMGNRREKHAVVYTGTKDGMLEFINNKWERDPSPERFALTQADLRSKTDDTAMVAVLKRVSPHRRDTLPMIRASVPVIHKNLSEILALSCQTVSVRELQGKLNTLFRPLLLDGITMLGLLEETELAAAFTSVQIDFLNALRSDADTPVCLGAHLPMDDFRRSVDRYIRLIEDRCTRSI